MPDYLDSEGVRISPQARERGEREERYATALRDWREGRCTDAEWTKMRTEDKEFDRWVWRIGGGAQ